MKNDRGQTLYNWALVLVDEEGNGTYVTSRESVEDMCIDIPDTIKSLERSGFLGEKIDKHGLRAMRAIREELLEWP